MTAPMGHAPSHYFYAPESRPDSLHHGHFHHHQHQTPSQHQPQHLMGQMSGYPMVPTLPSTPIYSRPGSSCSQQAAMPPTLYSNGPGAITPIASPQPAHHKPTILLETDGIDDNLYFPSTPPLSTAGSSISSPNSCDMLQTPMNPMFSGLDGLEGPKESFEPVENPILDWATCGSPPLSPGRSNTFFFMSSGCHVGHEADSILFRMRKAIPKSRGSSNSSIRRFPYLDGEDRLVKRR